MEREVAQARESPEWKTGCPTPRALPWLFRSPGRGGKCQAGQRISLDRRSGGKRRRLTKRMPHAGSLFRKCVDARQNAMAALTLSNSRDVEYGVAFALAVAGESSRSQALTDDLSRRFPEDTKVSFTFTPTLRAFLL